DEGEISFDLDTPSESEFDLDSMSLEAEPAAATMFEPLPEPEPEPEPAPAFEPAAISPAFELPDLELEEPTPSLEDFSFDAPVEEPPAAPPTDVFFGVESQSVAFDDGPAAEEIGEIDFYIEQELFDEARGKLD